MLNNYDDKIREDSRKEAEEYMRNQLPEPVICKHFGCGKRLFLNEEMFGDYCREHSIKKETDILNVIKFK